MILRKWILISFLPLSVLSTLSLESAEGQKVEHLGPGGGGYISAIKIDPNNSNIIYITGDNCGIYKSTDGGASWDNKNDGIFNYPTGDLVIHPSNSNTLWVATTGGLFKSTNGGDTWVNKRNGLPALTQSSPGREWDDLKTVYIYPQDPDIMFAGCGKTTIHRTSTKFKYVGFKSTDGGESWSEIPNGNGGPSVSSALTVTSFAIDPFDSEIVYMGSNQGLYNSTNGGANWSRIDNAGPNPIGENWISKVETVQNSSTKIYASTAPASLTATGGLYRSLDGGVNWSRVNPATWNTNRTHYFKLLSSDGNNIMASFAARLHITTNGGTSWTNLGKADDPGWMNYEEKSNNAGVWVFDVLPGETNKIIHGFAAPLITADNGANWIAAYTTKDAQSPYGWSNKGFINSVVSDVLVDPDNSNHIIFAEYDYTINRSTDGGRTWVNLETYFRGNHSPEPDNCYAIQKEGSTYYALLGKWGNNYFTSLYTSTDGTNWTSRHQTTTEFNDVLELARMGATLKVFVGNGANGIDVSTNLTEWSNLSIGNNRPSFIIQDPDNPDIIYIGCRTANGSGNGGLYKSTNFGVSWSHIDTHANLLDLRSFTVKPGDSNTIFAGTSGYQNIGKGGVYKSTNGGTTWTQVDTNIALPHESSGSSRRRWASSLAFSTDGSRLYVGFYSPHRDSGHDKGAYYSEDEGQTWTKVLGLDTNWIKNIKPDPSDNDIVWVATEGGGVFRIDLSAKETLSLKAVENFRVR